MNELYKKGRGTSQMSEQFGPNFALGSFALQQSIRLVYTLRALSRGRNRATRVKSDNQMYTHRKSTHTLGNRDTTQQPEAGRCCCRAAATAAAAAAAAVLLLCCCCAAAASRPSMHRGAQPVSTDCFSFVFFGTHAGASNGTAAAAAAAVLATAAAA